MNQIVFMLDWVNIPLTTLQRLVSILVELQMWASKTLQMFIIELVLPSINYD
jgi:hypothetical protein